MKVVFTPSIEEALKKAALLSENEIRNALIGGEFGAKGSSPYEAISDQLNARAQTRAEAREEATLSIAKKSQRWSIWAVVIALLAVIISVKESIIVFILGQP